MWSKASAIGVKVKSSAVLQMSEEGHVVKMCSSQKREPPSKQYVQDVSQVVNIYENALEVEGVNGEMVDLGFTLSFQKKTVDIKVQLLLEGRRVTMEVNTGSAVSVISETEYKNLFKDFPLQPTSLQLRTYSDDHQL